MNEKYWYLKKCEIFSDLPSGELATLELDCQCREFKRGQTIYSPLDEADCVLLLAKGRVRIAHQASEGKQAILGFVEPTELLGEVSVFSDGYRNEFAEALERTTVLAIPKLAVQQILRTHPQVGLRLTRLFAEKVQRAESRLKSLLFRTTCERLIYLLSKLAETYGQPAPNGIVIAQKFSHQNMASIIGATRETVTITLRELQSEGLLTINQRRINVTKRLTFPADQATTQSPVHSNSENALKELRLTLTYYGLPVRRVTI